MYLLFTSMFNNKKMFHILSANFIVEKSINFSYGLAKLQFALCLSKYMYYHRELTVLIISKHEKVSTINFNLCYLFYSDL